MQTTSAPATRLPFGPLVTTRTVWLVASVWAPVGGLIEVGLGCLEGGARGGGMEMMATPWWVALREAGVVVCMYGAARRAYTARSRAAAIGWTVAGAMAVPVLFTLAVFACRAPEWLANALLGYGVLPFYAVLGASWQALLPAMLFPSLRSPSVEATDRAVRTASIWLWLPNTLWAVAWIFFSSHARYAVAGSVPVALLWFAPFALTVTASARIALRRRWLRRVEEGLVSGWRLGDPVGPPPTGLPVLGGNRGAQPRLLSRAREAGDPFRSTDFEPVAWAG